MSLPGNIKKSLRGQGVQPEMLGLETPKKAKGQSVKAGSISGVPKAGNSKEVAETVDQGEVDELDDRRSLRTLASRHSNKGPSCLKSSSQLKAEKRLKELELKRVTLEEDLLRTEMELENAMMNEGGQEDYGHVPTGPPVLPPVDRVQSIHNWFESSHVPVTVPDEPASPGTSSVLEKLLARQSVPKDLPAFSGEPGEWQLFIRQYDHSTKVCGLSNEENAIRLAKSLKGRAYDAVTAMLGLPDNVPLVIDTLRRTFGRPDLIVKSMITRAKSVPAVLESKPDSLVAFSNAVRSLVATMKNLGSVGHMQNPQLLEELVQKLPYSYQMMWCLKIRELHYHDLSTLDSWLGNLADAACLMPMPEVSPTEEPKEKMKQNKIQQLKQVAALPAKPESRIPGACLVCKQPGHKVAACADFMKADVDARLKLAKEKRLCYVCLIPGHSVHKCYNKKECGTNGCSEYHHTLLHKPKGGPSEKPNFVGHGTGASSVLLKVLPVRLEGPLGVVETYALIDDGCTVTMIDSILAEKLGLDGQLSPLCMQWTKNVTHEEENSKKVTAKISGVHNAAKSFTITNMRTVKDLSLPAQTIDMDDIRSNWPHLKNVLFSSIENEKPMILLGQDNANLTLGRKVVTGGENDPVATKTHLGWVVHGPTSKAANTVPMLFHSCTESADEELNTLVKDSFSLEYFGVKNFAKVAQSHDEERTMMLLETTTKRVGERFETGLLWKSDDFTFPESKNDALRRLWCMERKMDRDHEFADAYCQKIEEYVAKGYAVKLSPQEAGKVIGRTRYIPHFAVFNPNKPGKMRFVFDAASKSGGVSLNDAFLTGPDLLKPITGILWRFRRGKIGFTGDVREMFHQVLIREEDQDCLRFLWRGKDRKREPDVYRMRAMIFGAACSPASAIHVLSRNAEDFRAEFPEAVETIQTNTYMDDTIDSCNSIEETTKRIMEIIEVDRRGGFTVCNWICSSREVLEAIPKELRGKNWQHLDMNSALPTERILGLWWNAEEYKFTFKINFHKVNERVLKGLKLPTKREVLQLIMSLFDPLGLIAHFMIKGRIIFQEIWKTGIGWDDSIPSGVLEKDWKKWLEELQLITTVGIPRCYSKFLEKAKNIQLHAFNDASTEAFASAIYLRVEHDCGIDVCLVTAKARVKPLKEVTIPRMELQAALMGSRIAASLHEELKITIDSTILWSDSQTVICWLKSDKKLSRWEDNRRSEILELTKPEQWRWVPTDYNPSDLATRKNKKTEFSTDGMWFSGPEFLRKPETEWPVLGSATAAEVETEEVVLVASTIREPYFALPDIRRFSCWLKLIRTTAWILRYVRNFCKTFSKTNTEFPDSGELRVDELKRAELLWVKQTQTDEFSIEIDTLKRKKSLPKGSKLSKLAVFHDENDVIRLKSRTELSNDLKFDAKFPIVLGCTSMYVNIFLRFQHKTLGHQGVDSVIYLAQEKYWILGIRNLVKKIVHECQFCSNTRAKPCDPEMGLLPAARVNKGTRPFLTVGADFFGPLYVKVGRKQEKRYGLIFTCMTVRAVHIELTESLTTDSTLNAIRRFASRRGYPNDIFCDNGSSFRGCERELKALVDKVDKSGIQRALTAYDIQ